MKFFAIVLLFSLMIACNAALDYMSIADKVVAKLLKFKDPLNGTFDKSINEVDFKCRIKQTKFYDWNRLELNRSSVQGSQLTNNVHDLQFEMNLPSPIIKGKMYYQVDSTVFSTSEITAISTLDIIIKIRVIINEFYRDTVWKTVSLVHPLTDKFASKFDCEYEDMSDCDLLIQWIDGDSGAWNQPSQLIGRVKRLIYAIKYV